MLYAVFYISYIVFFVYFSYFYFFLSSVYLKLLTLRAHIRFPMCLDCRVYAQMTNKNLDPCWAPVWLPLTFPHSGSFLVCGLD